MGTTGGNINLTAGLISQAVPIVITQNNSLTQGAGFSTLVQRTANMPSDQGLVNVNGAGGVTLQNMAFDGNVTTPATLVRSAITGPTQASFLLNTTVWVTGGTTDLTISNVKFSHTGGYAIFLDARLGNITNVLIENCTFVNNRPMLFGISSGDLTYGSWLGGIFYYNMSDGTNEYFLKNITIQNCIFQRNAGNNIWGACNGFETPNQNIQVINCQFEDTGLDAVELSNVNGFTVSGNQGHRIGWIATTDTGTTVPKYDSGFGAVFVDTSSNVYNGVYEANTATSLTGQGINCDGLYDSAVRGNTLLQPLSTDPLYTQDSIATCGVHGAANEAVGIQTGNTYTKLGGQHVSIEGNTVKNMGYTALSLVNLKDSLVLNNTIWHSGSAGAPPIEITVAEGYDNGVLTDGNGSIGTTADAAQYRSWGNLIAHNRITYGADTPAANFCIVEIDNGSQTFKAADQNRIMNNILSGTNYGEFLKNANSGSYTGYELHTNDNTATSGDVTRIQREGHGASATTKMYAIVAGTGTQISQLSDAGFLNISTNGTAGTGNVATGSRSTLAWPDSMASGKVDVDAFMSFTDSTYLAADANILGASYGVIRFNSSTNVFEVSTSVSGGARVWNQMLTSSGGGSDVASLNALTGSLTLAGASNQITISPSGTTITISLTTNVTVTGTASSAGLTLTNGFMYSSEGFYTPDSQSTAINVPNGGGTFGLGVAVGQAIYLAPWSSTTGLNVPGSGYSAFTYKSGSTFWYYNTTTSAFATVDFSSIGSGVTSLTGTSNEVIVSGSTGAITLSLPQAIATGSSPTFASLLATNTLQAGNTGLSGTAVTFQNTNSAFSVNYQGDISSAGVILSTSSFNCTGTATNSIQTAGGFKGKTLELTGTTNTQVFSIDAGFMSSAQGYYSPGNAVTTVNIPSGGAQFGLGVQVNTGLWMKGTSLGNGSGQLGPPTSGYGGLGYTGSAGNYFIWNGTSYSTVNLTSGTGVTSIVAGTGISVSGTTTVTVTNSGIVSVAAGTGVSVSTSSGTATVSLPQAIATNSNVDFGALYCSSTAYNAISTAGGFSGYTVQTTDTAYNSIASAGGVSSSGGFYIGSTQVINSSGTFIGFGVNCAYELICNGVASTAGITATGFNPKVGGIQYTGASGPYSCYWSGGFTISGLSGTYHTLEFAGGCLIGIS